MINNQKQKDMIIKNAKRGMPAEESTDLKENIKDLLSSAPVPGRILKLS